MVKSKGSKAEMLNAVIIFFSPFTVIVILHFLNKFKYYIITTNLPSRFITKYGHSLLQPNLKCTAFAFYSLILHFLWHENKNYKIILATSQLPLILTKCFLNNCCYVQLLIDGCHKFIFSQNRARYQTSAFYYDFYFIFLVCCCKFLVQIKRLYKQSS